MTKRLSPERIAEMRGSWNARGHVDWEPDLMGHIEAIEAELRDEMVLTADWHERFVAAFRELAEAKAEIKAINIDLHNTRHERSVAERALAEAKADITRLTLEKALMEARLRLEEASQAGGKEAADECEMLKSEIAGLRAKLEP